MHRLTLSDYALTILLLVALALGLSYGLQQWLTQVSSETSGRIERAGRIWQ
jgi:Tfp pilus assembly protein PilP